MNELALFAGAGGGILGGKLIGWSTCCAVEIDPFREGILLTRQNEHHLPIFPVWDDVSTFDGIFGTRSGLVREMLRIIGEVRPAIGLFENSPLLTIRGLEHVLFALAKMGYDAKWGVLGANQAGASHGRKRCWIVASDPSQVRQTWGNFRNDVSENRQEARFASLLASRPFPTSRDHIPPPHVFRNGDGMAHWLDAVSACGDGQVPAVVKLAWETLRP